MGAINVKNVAISCMYFLFYCNLHDNLSHPYIPILYICAINRILYKLLFQLKHLCRTTSLITSFLQTCKSQRTKLELIQVRVVEQRNKPYLIYNHIRFPINDGKYDFRGSTVKKCASVTLTRNFISL